MASFAEMTTPLSSGAYETMWCLFYHGPTWTGNLPSKQGALELHRRGLGMLHQGWWFLTDDGHRSALTADMGARKDKQSRRTR